MVDLGELSGPLDFTSSRGECRLDIGANGEISFHGFTVDEVRDLLAAYREHLTLMIDVGQQVNNVMTSGDAVRYTPRGGLDDARPRP